MSQGSCPLVHALRCGALKRWGALRGALLAPRVLGRLRLPLPQYNSKYHVTLYFVVCVECLIGKQKKPILFKVTEPSSIPYQTPPAYAKMAAYPDPPPVIPVPESIAAQAAYQLRYENTEYYSWVSSWVSSVNRGTLAPCRLKESA